MPAKTKNRQKSSITFRPPVTLKKRLMRDAAEQNRTLSGHINHLLLRSVENPAPL